MKNLFVAIGVTLCLVAQVIPAVADQKQISRFVENVAIHVLTHELGHAILREFQLPILGNEESIADSFAIIAIHRLMPNRVQEIVLDRAQSYRLEAERDGLSWEMLASEHEHDFRRAFWSFCVLEGLEPEATKVPDWVHMSDSDRKDCEDIANDLGNSWSRALDPYLSNGSVHKDKVELIFGEGALEKEMRNTNIMQRIGAFAAKIDWPNKITLHFDHCSEGASWSRSKRRILLCDEYLNRFTNYEEEAKRLFP